MASISVLGYPSSAAAYCVGVEEAPQALRAAGLVDALRARGHSVRDHGDLPVHRWRPDLVRPRAQNLAEEVAALRDLAAATAPLLVPDRRVLLIGGSCTIALGSCAAATVADLHPGLVYLDRHLDLNTPESTSQGSLSWMGMAHALGLPGTEPDLVGLLGPGPLLAADRLSYLGVDPTACTTWELEQVDRHGISVVEQAALVSDGWAAADEARGALPSTHFLVHLDVDVLEFQDAPLAEDVNGRNSGPTLEQLAPALARLWGDPHCLGLSVGQLVPAHATSDPTALVRFIDAVVPPGAA